MRLTTTLVSLIAIRSGFVLSRRIITLLIRFLRRDIGRIARYTVEMGGGIELLETALRVPPWEPLYALGRDEIHRLRLTTLDRLFDQDIGPVAAQPVPRATPAFAPSDALATVAATRGGND